jgi:HD-like signal output (HDOD) protein
MIKAQSMSEILSISELKPEMILDADLKAYNGRFLLPKDLPLAEKHIRVMKMWGVVEAPIKNAAAPCLHATDDAAPAKGRNPTREILRSRFCCVSLDHPAISALYRCALTRPDETKRRKTAGTTETRTPNRMGNEGAAFLTEAVKGDSFWNALNLPTLPNVFVKIHDAIVNPRSSAYEIAALIGKDTGLTARLLKMANSAFYGFPAPIDSIQRAVTLIGAKQLTTLSYAVSIVDVFKDMPADCCDIASFWRHSVACGVCARILAGYKCIHNTERLFVAGLLHDIGRLLLFQHAPLDMARLLLEAGSEGRSLHELESEVLGLDHAALGGRLLRNWGLPALLEDMVRFHHQPEKAANGMEAAIVHIADVTINAIGAGSSGEVLAPPLNREAWETLGLSEHNLTAAVRQMDQQMKDVYAVFFPHEETIRQYSGKS